MESWTQHSLYAESLSCGETWWRVRLRLSIPYTESRSSGGDLCMAQPTELIVQQLRKWPVAFELRKSLRKTLISLVGPIRDHTLKDRF